MGFQQQMARTMDRVYDRLRDPAAFEIRPDDAAGGTFEGLRGHKYAVVVSYRRSGEPVPSPVWFGVDAQGRVYLHTSTTTGKVKRLGHDSRVLVAPSNARGKPRGPVRRGTGRILPKEEWPHAEDTLAASYGPGRKVYERLFGIPEEKCAYIEISPVTGG